jgi:hypothetical protein
MQNNKAWGSRLEKSLPCFLLEQVYSQYFHLEMDAYLKINELAVKWHKRIYICFELKLALTYPNCPVIDSSIDLMACESERKSILLGF